MQRAAHRTESRATATAVHPAAAPQEPTHRPVLAAPSWSSPAPSASTSNPRCTPTGVRVPPFRGTEAVTICEARGARLCTEAGREGACPGGQATFEGGNQAFCFGPSNTWEWSTSTTCADGRCVSPCCNSVLYPCQCTKPATDTYSYRCCRDLWIKRSLHVRGGRASAYLPALTISSASPSSP